ncbi:uncharacterized protein [Centruroides vittatus]|uniref:uncharacterized protein n=1 Tax=Centruroides vittatus TaxID=120091 RepID=UPI00350FE1BC
MCLLEQYPGSYKDIKRDLIKCFSKREAGDRDIVDQLLNLRQGSSESVTDFSVRTRTLLARAVKDNEKLSMLRDDVILERFIKGLRGGLKSNVLRRAPKTLDEAFEIAETEESIEVECNGRFERRGVSIVTEERSDTVVGGCDSMESRKDKGDKRIIELEKKVDTLVEAVSRLLDERKRESRDTSNKRCYACDNVGHFARDCPSRKNPHLNW